MNEEKYCQECGLLCNITKKIYKYHEDTGKAFYEHRAKCPKYGLFTLNHSYFYRRTDDRYYIGWVNDR